MDLSETLPNILEQFEYPDQELSVGSVILGEKARDSMKDKTRKRVQKERILKAVVALMNSGGGIVCVDIENQTYTYDTEGLGLDLEKDLKQLVSPSAIEDYFEFLQHGMMLQIFVKSWSSDGNRTRLCCVDTGLRERSATSVSSVENCAMAEFLKKKEKKRKTNKGQTPKRQRVKSGNSSIKQFAQDLYAREEVQLGEVLPFGESVNVELKSFKGEKSFLKRFKEIIPKYVSAFANTEGGYLFIGVDDETREVVGCGHGCTCDRIKTAVEEMCSKVTSVHASDCKQEDSWSVEVRILKVVKEEDDGGCFVVAVHIPEFCCMVFEKDPDCWEINDGQICPVKAEQWLKYMQDIDPAVDICSQFRKVLSISAAPPKCKPVYGLKEDHLSSLQQILFPVNGPGITIAPESLKKLFEKYPNLQNVLMPGAGQGTLILSNSWAVDIGIPKNSEVICEALLICEHAPPTLYCIVERGSPALWHHARAVALCLKQMLVNLGGYQEWLCVIPQLVDCEAGQLIPKDEGTLITVTGPQYPDCYRLGNTDVVKALLQALVIVVLSFTSALSNQLGQKFLNLLTIEQFQVLQSKYDIEHIRELFVHGCPGTGKTVIATLLLKRIKNTFGCQPRNILYICENTPLKKFIQRENICQSVTRSCFMKNDFPEVKHIIVDEAQNFRLENGNWYKKAKEIVGKKNGVFWVFLDYFQQSHTVPTGLPLIGQQTNIIILTKIVRNSMAVHEKVLENLAKIRYVGRNERQRQHMDKMITQTRCEHTYKGRYTETFASEEHILHKLISLVKELLQSGYAPGSIAVLCSTRQEAITCASKLERTLNQPLPQAEMNDSNHIVVDSVRRFSGLERNVVILYDLTVHPLQNDIGTHFNISAISRARTALYVLSSSRRPQPGVQP